MADETKAPTTEEVRAALAQAERDDRRASGAYSGGPDTAPGYEMALEVAEHRDALAAALAKIDAIRNSIIGRQGVNWSAHIYPLVAALDEAGYGGEGYEVARPKAEAERAALRAVFDDRDALGAEVARLRPLADALSAAHDALDTLQDGGSLNRIAWDEHVPRELSVAERIRSLAQEQASAQREPHPNEVALAADVERLRPLAELGALALAWGRAERRCQEVWTALECNAADDAANAARAAVATAAMRMAKEEQQR